MGDFWLLVFACAHTFNLTVYLTTLPLSPKKFFALVAAVTAT